MRFLIASLLFVPLSVYALRYNTDNLPYSDAPADRPTALAISTLTDIGILKGNPDGTIKPNVTMNRAEFVEIAMRLLPPDHSFTDTRCFSDVDRNVWFARSVCRAKDLGIVRGNALSGLDPDEWPFQPTRSVKYEEAVKVLSGIYDIPLFEATGGEWYVKYTNTAFKFGIDLKDSAIGSALTRGQMARLTVAFMAFAKGELALLRAAENSSSMSSIPVRTVFASSSVSSVSSVSSSSVAPVYDPLINDTSTDESVLVLGQVTHILGSAELFSHSEAINIDAFIIELKAANDSIDALNVYDHDAKLLGRATLDRSVAGDIRYRLNVKGQGIQAPYRDDFSFYVRGVLRPQDAGGTSGGSVQIDRMGIEGTGHWSSRDYEQFTDASETFSESQVAQSSIMGVENAGDANDILVEGTDREVGSFRFTGTKGHSSADIRITAIVFQIEQAGSVTLKNPTLKADGSSDRHVCSVVSDEIHCLSIPASFGDLEDAPRVLDIFADIDVPDTSQSASLRLSISDPGTVSTAGSITWTDGVTIFTWVDNGGQRPVARSTYYSY